MKKYQINRHVDVDGDCTYSISEYSENGYRGRTTDTSYSDGCAFTDWCIFVGTKSECEEYIKNN